MSRYTEATYNSYKLLLTRGSGPESGYPELEPGIKLELYELGKTIITQLPLEEHEYEHYIQELCYLLGV